MIKKWLKRIILFLALLIIAVLAYLTLGNVDPAPHISWGVSFSKNQAESLGLNWKQVYISILDDLDVTHLRIPSYWSDIEPVAGVFKFDDLDFQIQEAKNRGRSIVLVVGRRQPRWPECHIPLWAKDLSLEDQNQAVLNFTTQVVERYKDSPAISAWQVENEFYLDSFGDCPDYDKSFLDVEVAKVKSLDNRPIIITDSGELSWWVRAAHRDDVLGVSMYRTVLNPMFGYITYPHPPEYYSRLGKLVQLISGNDRLVISELQMEPWGNPFIGSDSTEENYKSFPPEQFEKNTDYARRSGVDEVYLWGVEWWYYMKEKRDISTFWDQARILWN